RREETDASRSRGDAQIAARYLGHAQARSGFRRRKVFQARDKKCLTGKRVSNQYFPGMIDKAGDAAFKKQCIPTTKSLLGIGGYKKFLQTRRSLIAKRLNEFLGANAGKITFGRNGALSTV